MYIYIHVYIYIYTFELESTCQAGDAGLSPGSGRSFGEGNGNPPQYSYLWTEYPMDRGDSWATVHGVANELNRT